ncbi:hypothetical protein NP590_02895 [Methylomonas sp. SURF-2]|uniref:Uncharacterized protein n=1 Tax=Methylomonas subterranea TaxID=2952225 RepID=A0ABT1TC64_9GAMM|nr:hypothetical protein [Methylomonas sp. SURF-2]MCQ8103043.1 hypothetical protein [Methylomonas sp. SURF-2]
MLEDQIASQRVDFFEQIHHEFLYLKGYGAYAYMTPHEVDQLYESYLAQQVSIAAAITPQTSVISFIRSFIKSL